MSGVASIGRHRRRRRLPASAGYHRIGGSNQHRDAAG